MNAIAYLALLAYPPLVLALYLFMTPRRACLVAFMIAGLFLPVAAIHVHLLPAYDKTSLPSFCVLLGTLLFDAGRFARFRISKWDIPMIIWGICPLFSSVHNNLGFYDGLATALAWATMWFLPYLCGRLYFETLSDVRELVVAIAVGGLIYVPLCLIEIRLSPQLHRILYGFHQHAFAQERRDGGFRPTVFMQHGLAVGTFMMVAALSALAVWFSGVPRRLLSINSGWAFLFIFGTTILCKAMMADIMLVAGAAALIALRSYRNRLVIIALILVPLAHIALRGSGLMTGDWLVKEIATVSRDRSQSLGVRLLNENLFLEQAMKSPIFGHASVDWFPTDKLGRSIGVPDALWVISVSRYGLVGGISLLISLLLPAFLLIRRCPRDMLAHPAVIPLTTLAIIVALHMIDNLLNAMIQPIYLVAAGAVMTLVQRPMFWAVGTGRGMKAQKPAEQRLWRPDGSSTVVPSLRANVPQLASAPRQDLMMRPQPLPMLPSPADNGFPRHIRVPGRR